MSPIKRKSKKEDSGMADKDPGYSPFVQAVAGDGTSAPDVRVLTGWLGASGEEGHVRLYLDATLSAYVDIPRDAVLYSEEIPNSHPAGQRSVWVKNDAELKEGGSAIARAAKFLFGQVRQDFLGAAGVAQPQAPQTQICLTFRPGCQPTAPPCATAAPCTCPGPVTVKWPDCGSAVDACPTRICDFAPQGLEAAGPAPTAGFCVPRTQTLHCRPRTMTPCPTMLGCGLEAAAQPELAQQQVGGPWFATRFCTPPPPSLAACPTPTILGCPTAGFCPPRTIGCPVPSAFCPTRFNCPFPSQLQCPSFGRCPSAVDACPSALGCTFACDFNWTVVQQTPVLQQPQFNQQFGFAPDPGQPLPPPGTQQTLLRTSCPQCPPPPLVTATEKPMLCCHTVIGPICGPKPSVGQQCQTQNPALCPNPNPNPLEPFRAQASGPGWTCNCPPPPHHTGHPAITCGPCTGFAQQQVGAGADFVGWTLNHHGCTGHVPCATCTVCW